MPGVCAMRVASSALSRFSARSRSAVTRASSVCGLDELRLLDLAIDLEPPQLAEHGARLRGEPIGLRLQRADARRDAIGLRFGIGLREELGRRNARDDTSATEHEARTWLRPEFRAPCSVAVRQSMRRLY